MEVNQTRSFDRYNAIFAIGVWLVTLVVYTLTKAPTLSLWDSGEFIAASAILGIPHPPGTPLYILIGRIFTIIPFFEDIATRVNWLSGLCSSFAAMFGYLTAVRLMRPWLGRDRTVYSKVLMYGGAISGALLLAFGRTAWNNAVEAEVYGMSMMLMMAMAWLTLIYLERRGTSAGNRILLVIVYLAFLGIGVHMSTFLILPVSALVFIINKDTPRRFWFLLGAWFALELYLIFALSSQPGELPLWLPILIVFIAYLFYALSFEKIPAPLVIVGAGFMLSSSPLVAVVAGISSTPFDYLATASFLGLLLYAGYLIFDHLKKRGKAREANEPALYASYFVIASAFMSFLIFTGIRGYSAFIVLSLILTVIIALFVWRYINVAILIALGGVSMVIISMNAAFWGTIIATAVVLVLGLIFRYGRWRTALLIPLMAVLGFSVHLFIPIRSAQDPMLNENNPSQNLTATINFLERKQYGSQGMVERMFERRGQWEHQFGVYNRMAFWSFLQEQYGLGVPWFFILFILGVFGLWDLVRRRPEAGLFILILLLLASVGLVLYMNFSDGTVQFGGRDYIEVRNRDYFFTPAFMLFGLAIGIGSAAIIQFLRESIRNFSVGPKRLILSVCMVVFLFPVYALAFNWYYCDRSSNYIPFDYGWNLLMSAPENAALFTYGDNDTFPLWCLQEAYGIRKDVRVVNLTLSNTKWYIKQVQEYMGLDLGMSEQQIDDMQPYRTQDGRTFRLQDQVFNAVVDNNPGVPIYISVTVGSGGRRYHGYSADSMLILRGMAFQLDTTKSQMSVDVDYAIEFFSDSGAFRYKSMTDTSFHWREALHRVAANVSNAMHMSAEGVTHAGEYEAAKDILRKALQISPRSQNAITDLSTIFALQGQFDSIDALQWQYPQADERQIRLALAQAYRRVDSSAQAKQVLEQLLADYPSWRPALEEILRLYVKANDPDGMARTLQRWLQYNPNDQAMQGVFQRLMQQLQQRDQIGGDTGQ